MVRPARSGADGMVTAEAALVMPTLALLALALAWLVALGVDEVRVTDAARDAARAVSRGDGAAGARAAATRTAGAGATVAVSRTGGLLKVTVTRRVSPPDWLIVPFPSATLRAAATVEDEEDAGVGG